MKLNPASLLPKEIMFEIFEFVGSKDVIKNCTLVSKKWKEIALDEVLLKKLFKEVVQGLNLPPNLSVLTYFKNHAIIATFGPIRCAIVDFTKSLGLNQKGILNIQFPCDQAFIKLEINKGIINERMLPEVVEDRIVMFKKNLTKTSLSTKRCEIDDRTINYGNYHYFKLDRITTLTTNLVDLPNLEHIPTNIIGLDHGLYIQKTIAEREQLRLILRFFTVVLIVLTLASQYF